jgi:D-serine deaminase-like pyridoxal phosphate-dependent protein
MPKSDEMIADLEAAQRGLESVLDLLLELGLKERRRRAAAQRRRALAQEHPAAAGLHQRVGPPAEAETTP